MDPPSVPCELAVAPMPVPSQYITLRFQPLNMWSRISTNSNKRARLREKTGEARLPHHGRSTAEVAECVAERVPAKRVAEREQAGCHLLGYSDLVRSFIVEWVKAGKAWPPPRG
jgi:hypothetical protein